MLPFELPYRDITSKSESSIIIPKVFDNYSAVTRNTSPADTISHEVVEPSRKLKNENNLVHGRRMAAKGNNMVTLDKKCYIN